jgi:hypothetical protein
MHFQCHAYCTPKFDVSAEECADAYITHMELGRFALADGTAVSTMPEVWARKLVYAYCYGTIEEQIHTLIPTSNWSQWLNIARKYWKEEYITRLERISPFIRNMLENNLKERRGAHSTFVGVEINTTHRSWCATIRGDTCLFHIENGELAACYPFNKPEQFSNFPETFHSLSSPDEPEPIVVTGNLRHSTVFILATDALAEWILRKYQHEGNNIFDVLWKVKNQVDFDEFVDRARHETDLRLKDDDTSLMMIKPLKRKRPQSPPSNLSSFPIT